MPVRCPNPLRGLLRPVPGIIAGIALGLASNTSQAANQFVAEYALPRGGTRGTTVELTIGGNYMESPKDLFSNRGGIRLISIGEPVENKPNMRFLVYPHVAPQVVNAKIEIAPDCPLGEHLVFLRTSRFLAEPFIFFVGAMPIVEDLEKKIGDNDSPEKAQAVPLNGTVHGQIEWSQTFEIDRDFYSVQANAGQRLSFELEAVRLGTLHYGADIDCFLRVYGPDGQVLAACDDTELFVQDPLISIKAPVDGRYLVEVSQQEGSANSRFAYYRLHVGTFPRPITVYPLGGRPGEKITAMLLGDGLGPKNVQITLPNSPAHPAPLDFYSYFPEDNGMTAPSPLPMRVSYLPNVLEAEPNDTLEQAATFKIPSALNGVIQKAGDVDIWRFHGEKGQPIDIRVYGLTLGSPIDPKIWIRPARPPKEDEKPLAEVDDGRLADRGYFTADSFWQPKGVLDPALTFTPKESGEFILGIEDVRSIGRTNFVYRVEVEPHVDTICVCPYDTASSARNSGLQIPQGNTWSSRLKLVEGLGTSIKGELTLEAVGLPQGVTMIAPTVYEGQRDVLVQFSAKPDAPLVTGFFQILVRPVDPKQQLVSYTQRGMSFAERLFRQGWRPVWMDKFPIGVVEPAPFHLEVEQPPYGLTRNGEMELNVKIIRHHGWNGALEVKPDWTPPGTEIGGPVVVAPGQATAVINLRATNNAALKKWKLSVFGTTTEPNTFVLDGSGCRLVASPFVDLTVTEPFVSVTFQRGAIAKGSNGELVATLKHYKPFSGKAKATLKRLPSGVKQLEPYPEISAGDGTCVFKVEVSNEALTGQYKEIQAIIAVPEGGQVIRQQSGSGVLRIDPARGTSSNK